MVSIMIYFVMNHLRRMNRCDAHNYTMIFYSYYGFCYMMMSEQLIMFKCKLNCISHKNLFFCASKLSLTKKNHRVIFQLKDENNVKTWNKLNMQIYDQWLISKSWYFDIASNFVQLRLVDFDVQFHASHAILRAFA